MMHSERTLRWTAAAGVVFSVIGVFIATYVFQQHYTAAFETAILIGLSGGGLTFIVATIRFDIGGKL